ncbi:MAG: transposase [Acidobacteria bacterium]|nr:MAG: transposase [Acidobacteriota bacterium]
MTYDPQRHHRRSIRLKGYDYSQAGAYFITVCVQDRACPFGEIVDGQMRLNEYGECAVRWWEDIPRHFVPVDIDAFVVMPNHVHGIILITDPPVGAGSPRPGPRIADAATGVATDAREGAKTAGAETAPLRRPSLGNVMAYFKYQSAKHLNALRQIPAAPVWQRNYYEHIIRNEESLNRIRQYILNNPARWAFDRENPRATAPEPADLWPS